MVINYFGNGCFRLQSGDTSILVNPENGRLKADIILRTIISTEEGPETDSGDSATIAFPGEYEVKGIEIVGFPIVAESTEKFVLLGHLSAPIDATLVEEFGDPDVLILPVGGGHFLEPAIAAKIAKQLEARIVIPSFYKNSDEFLKALGKKADVVEKFVFKQKDLVSEKGRPVVLKEG
jgi:L-ascorbate metabolism protein UlaG (beta-lactamase superfamily)